LIHECHRPARPRLDRTIQYAALIGSIAHAGDYWMPRFRGARRVERWE
jgi:hypothetical protein